MSNPVNENPLRGQCVYIVSCYQSILGVYADFDDAAQISKMQVAKGRPCDISTQIIK